MRESSNAICHDSYSAIKEFYNLTMRLLLTEDEKQSYGQYLHYAKHPEEYKRCRICGTIKHISCFYKHPMKKQGVFDECKECLRRKASDRRRKASELDYPGENKL